MRLQLILCFVLLLHCSSGWTPEQFAVKVSDQLLNNRDAFIHWDYGGALVFDGIYKVSQRFGLSNYTRILDSYLDHFLTDPDEDGYKLLHGEAIDFGQAVGDTVGLFPIANLNRVMSQSGQPGYDNTTDLHLLKVVVEQYIYGWPKRLPDGTFSRTKGWPNEPDPGDTFLWADDQYMGVTLLARLAVHLQDPLLLTYAARQTLQFGERMEDPTDSLYLHGFNEADGHKSCCKWGRANGWGALGNLEVLEGFRAFPYLLHSPMYEELEGMFQKRVAALLPWQASDGRWHQVVNETSTFLETSCTAMFLISMVRGVEAGWLDMNIFHEPIMKAWSGLQSTVSSDGTVSGVCMGTGIGTDVAYYQSRPTVYVNASHGGIGILPTAATYMQTFLP